MQNKSLTFANFKNLLNIVVYLFCTNSLNAYANEGAEEKQRYQIDYVIFEHLNSDTHILRFEDIPYPKQDNKQYHYLTTNPHPMSPYQFSHLDKDQSVLAQAIKDLKRSRRVSILDSGSWHQFLSEEITSAPLRIDKRVSQERSLFGELQLRKSRFTHAEFKLYLGNTYSVPYSNISDWFLSNETSWAFIDLLKPLNDLQKESQPDSSILYTNLVYLNESRRIKDGEIHYIDHPVLSAIVTIKEAPMPDAFTNYLSYRIE